MHNLLLTDFIDYYIIGIVPYDIKTKGKIEYVEKCNKLMERVA
jgi:hypothetical protein